MVRVYGRLRSQATQTIQVEAATVEDAKAKVLAGLPANVDVIEFRHDSRGTGPVTLTATTRSTDTVPHEVTADDYATAYAQYRATIPAGYISLGIGMEPV